MILAWIMHGLFSLTTLPRLPHWLSYRVPSPPGWVAWGFALSVIAAACLLALRRRGFGLAVASAALFGVLISLYPFAPRVPRGIFQITALDCGGGESLFMVLPNRTTILVGACGASRLPASGGDPLRTRRWDPGDNIVSPYLWSRGIRSVDIFVLPQPGGGRLTGVASVLRNFRVKEFWYSALPPQPEAAELLGLLEARGARARRLEATDAPLRRSGMVVTNLSPQLPDASRSEGDPAQPVVMRISGSAGSFLLAGGLNEQEQESLLHSGADIRSLVLQASRGRSSPNLVPEFVARARPRIVLLGSGESYEKDKTDERPAEIIGARTFSTALDGAVTVEMKGGKVSVHCYRAPCR
jgi:competence protein ComEC